MPSTLATIQAAVVSRIKDAAGRLSTTTPGGDVERCILAALSQYQRDKPHAAVVSFAGDGGFDYALADVVPTYVDGYSSIASLIYPYAAGVRDTTSLDEGDDFEIVRLPGGLYLRFLLDTPRESESVLLACVVPHTLTSETSTVPSTDEDALADLAAAYCCDELAAYYAQSTDASITADSVDRRSQSSEYRALSKTYAARYDARMGKTDDAAAAGAHVEIDRGFSDAYATDYFFHGRRRF